MTPTRRRPLRAAATAAILAALALAAAPRPAAAEDDQRAAAELYFRAGERAYNAGQYAAAAQAFEEAYELLPLPAIAFSTAQAYRLLYVTDKQAAYVRRAVELYRLYVAQVREGGRVPDAVASLAELEPVLLRIEADGQSTAMPVRAPTTRLFISSQASGVTVEVAGRTGTLPMQLEVEPGEYVVRGQAPGYFPGEQRAIAVEGALIPVEVELRPRPAALVIRAEAGARVSIGGRPAGTTPLARPIELPAGRHAVAVTRRGRVAVYREIDAGRGETIPLEVDLRPTAQRRAVTWVWVGAGALALAAGATGAYAFVEQGRALDLDAQRRAGSITEPQLDAYLRHRDNRDMAVRATWGLAAASVVTGAIGALLYVFDHPAAEAPPAALAPADGPGLTPFAADGGAGVSLRGRW